VVDELVAFGVVVVVEVAGVVVSSVDVVAVSVAIAVVTVVGPSTFVVVVCAEPVVDVVVLSITFPEAVDDEGLLVEDTLVCCVV
jgi:hypothetical protein